MNVGDGVPTKRCRKVIAVQISLSSKRRMNISAAVEEP